MNIIVSFKDLLDLTVVLCKMHSRTPFVDDSHSWDFLPSIDAVCRSNCQQIAAVQADRGRLLYSVFQYIAAVDFVQQFVQTSFAIQVTLNSP